MPVQYHVEHPFENEDASISGIARRADGYWRTATKYAQQEDCIPLGPTAKTRRRPAMDPMANIADICLHSHGKATVYGMPSPNCTHPMILPVPTPGKTLSSETICPERAPRCDPGVVVGLCTFWLPNTNNLPSVLLDPFLGERSVTPVLSAIDCDSDIRLGVGASAQPD